MKSVLSVLYISFAAIATISLFAACDNASRISRLIDASKITEIRVTILNFKTPGTDVLKTISTPTEIDNIVKFANDQVLTRSNFKSDMDQLFSIQDRTTLVDLAFYQSDKYLGTLGLGQFDGDKHFVKYRQYHSESECCEFKAALISGDQKKKLLDLIGYSERDFDSIPK